MSKKISLGLPSLGQSVAKNLTEKPALFLKEDAMYLNDLAMKQLSIKFVTGKRCKVALLAIANEDKIIIVNGNTTDVPNMVKSSIYKNGKIVHSKFQKALGGILEVNEDIEDKTKIDLLVNATHSQVLELDLTFGIND